MPLSTELTNGPKTCYDYVKFINDVNEIRNVEGITFFVASASDQTFEPETWVKEDGTRKGIATYIKDHL